MSKTFGLPSLTAVTRTSWLVSAPLCTLLSQSLSLLGSGLWESHYGGIPGPTSQSQILASDDGDDDDGVGSGTAGSSDLLLSVTECTAARVPF